MGVLGDFYKLGKMSMVQSQRDILRDEHKLRDLFWECTLSCNAACKHCGSSAEKKKYEGELSTEEIKKAFKQIANDMDAKKIWINVTGGEPLVRKDLCEVMEYATNELGFRWGMTSNGLLLDKDMLEKLKKANMESVSISIDGIGKTHDEFRGVEGAYEKTIRNIKNMVDSNYFMITEVTTVFHKKNIDQLEELYEVISELGVDVWRLIPMDPIGRAKENSEYLLNGDEVKRILEFIISKKRSKLKLEYGCPGYLGVKYEGKVGRAYFYCRTGISVAIILYNGDLYVCPNVPRIKKLIQGNIRKDNFKDVWDNKYKEFRDKNRTACSKCKKCDQWDFCLGGPYHTWNFKENKPNVCMYEMINKK